MDALSLDAANTLLHPVEPVAETYARFARAHGAEVSAEEVGRHLGTAMHEARALRLEDASWRAFWAAVVHRTTGCGATALLDELTEHYAHAPAWEIAEGAEACCRGARARGLKVAVISNWDHRLRPLLEELGVLEWIDLAVVSAEEGIEKPDPRIFERACARLGVAPAAVLHVGDHVKNDVEGARAVGCKALHFGVDLSSFAELAGML